MHLDDLFHDASPGWREAVHRVTSWSRHPYHSPWPDILLVLASFLHPELDRHELLTTLASPEVSLHMDLAVAQSGSDIAARTLKTLRARKDAPNFDPVVDAAFHALSRSYAGESPQGYQPFGEPTWIRARFRDASPTTAIITSGEKYFGFAREVQTVKAPSHPGRHEQLVVVAGDNAVAATWLDLIRAVALANTMVGSLIMAVHHGHARMVHRAGYGPPGSSPKLPWVSYLTVTGPPDADPRPWAAALAQWPEVYLHRRMSALFGVPYLGSPEDRSMSSAEKEAIPRNVRDDLRLMTPLAAWSEMGSELVLESERRTRLAVTVHDDFPGG